MPRQPRLTADEAEQILFQAGFEMIRSKGSHRIYRKGGTRVVIPFHSGETLHPKIVKQMYVSIEDAV
jgi:predicted RNA binding protein YcfA (HicA-like mRNA interferase family)